MQPNKDLKALDDLIVNLGGADHGTRSNGASGLLVEHLQAARRGLLGSMCAEYSSSLEQAKGSIACVSDKSMRAEIKNVVGRLIGGTQAARQRRSANVLPV